MGGVLFFLVVSLLSCLQPSGSFVMKEYPRHRYRMQLRARKMHGIRLSIKLSNLGSAIATIRNKPLPSSAAAAVLGSGFIGYIRGQRGPRSSFMAWVLYKIELWLSASLLSKLLLVGGGFLSLIMLGALWLNVVSERNTISKSLFKSMQLLCDSPGGDATGEESTLASVATHSLYFAGLVAFSFFIGIISTDVSNSFSRVAEGTFRVVERQHTVVANWNENTVSVLRQLASAQREGKKSGLPVVLLANRDKAEMDVRLASQLSLKERKQLRLITRSGNPSDPAALRRVAADVARRVIFLRPTMDNDGKPLAPAKCADCGTVEAKKLDEVVTTQAITLQRVRCALSSSAVPSSSSDQLGRGSLSSKRTTTVLNVPPTAANMARSARFTSGLFTPNAGLRKGRSSFSSFVVVPERSYISRMMAQTVLHPGIVDVHDELTTCDGNDFHTISASKLGVEGLTAVHVSNMLRVNNGRLSILCGTLREKTENGEELSSSASHYIWMPPSDQSPIKKNDRLVFIAPSQKDIKLSERQRRQAISKLARGVSQTKSEDIARSALAVPPQREDTAASHQKARPAARRKKRVLVLNWTPRAHGVLSHLGALKNEDNGRKEGLDVTVLTEPEILDDPEQRQLLQKELKLAHSSSSKSKGMYSVRVVAGRAMSRDDLERAGADDMDTVVLLRDEADELEAVNSAGPNGSTGTPPDSKSFVTLSFIDNLIREGTKKEDGRAPRERQLVAEFHSPSAMAHARSLLESSASTSSLGSSSFTILDLFVPEDFESGALVQIALDEHLESVFEQLLSAKMDLQLDDIGNYLHADEKHGVVDSKRPLTFGEVSEKIHKKGNVLVGLQRRCTTTRHPETILCPSKLLLCEPGDKLIVLHFAAMRQ